MAIDENGAVKLWDLSEYKSIFTAASFKNSRGSSCCIAKDDGSLVTGWRDGFIRAYETTGRVLWEIANAHRGSVTSLYCDANYILSGGEDGAVRVWARTTRKLLIQFNGKINKHSQIMLRLKERHRVFVPRLAEALLNPLLLYGQNYLYLRFETREESQWSLNQEWSTLWHELEER
jgi:WD40 repeat protein